ncbi:MAG: hypothetical protein Q4F21_09380 [Lachnospiraceae bacterium]|nr:hypothetical protein [Lachnospiraceae bacterium]
MSEGSNRSMDTVSFRRFLSYIYAYEDGTKLRNVGFAKVEVRAQRVRVQVSISGIFQKGGRPLTISLVDENQKQIPFGQIVLQNGRGEYRGNSLSENLWNTGLSFSQVCGICLQGAGSKHHYYMTLWSEKAKPAKIPHNQIVVIPQKEQETQSFLHAAQADSGLQNRISTEEVQADAQPEVSAAEIMKNMENIESAERVENIESAGSVESMESSWSVEKMESAENVETIESAQSVENAQTDSELEMELKAASELAQQPSAQQITPPELVRNPAKCRKKADNCMELWKKLCSRYPHVDIRPISMKDSFSDSEFTDSGKVCEVLRIRPNDIGRLPRNNWILAHNSFLQHSYNHYHQLILFRVENQNPDFRQADRWFIGLPGDNSEQETLVADVFGFKRFLKCKNGGYWYTEVYMGIY